MVITKNHNNSIVPLTGKDATIIAESSVTFLGLAGTGEVNKDNDRKPPSYKLNKMRKLSRVRRYQHHTPVFSPEISQNGPYVPYGI